MALPAAERAPRRALVGSGVASARRLTRVGVRRQCVAEGLETALKRKRPDRVYARALDGAAEGRLAVVACGAPDDGRERWMLRMVADEVVRLEAVAAVSHTTVRRTSQHPHASRG